MSKAVWRTDADGIAGRRSLDDMKRLLRPIAESVYVTRKRARLTTDERAAIVRAASMLKGEQIDPKASDFYVCGVFLVALNHALGPTAEQQARDAMRVDSRDAWRQGCKK